MTKNGEEQKYMNDKITTINNRGVKMHIGNTMGVKLNMKIFFFQVVEDIKTLKIESIGYNVGGH